MFWSDLAKALANAKSKSIPKRNQRPLITVYKQRRDNNNIKQTLGAQVAENPVLGCSSLPPASMDRYFILYIHESRIKMESFNSHTVMK